MRGLSLTQPWASLIAIGAKRIETRSWSTTYRGPVAIHAAKAFPRWARDLCREPEFSEPLAQAGYTYPPRHWYYAATVDVDKLPTGAIVAVAELIDCVKTGATLFSSPYRELLSDREVAFGNYESGRYAWVLRNARRLPEPIPCRGALGLWDVPTDVLARIEEALR